MIKTYAKIDLSPLVLTLLVLAFSSAAGRAAENISLLDTGAGLYSSNNGAVIVDPNWKVKLLQTIPPGQTPPGGIPTGAAYLVSNIGYPQDGTWVANDATSTWITYSTPTQTGPDFTNGVYDYTLTFEALNSGTVDLNLLSDNTGYLLLNGNVVGNNPNEFKSWLTTPDQFSVVANTVYKVDFLVGNDALNDHDPTGARVEFTGDVNVLDLPEPGSLALFCVGLGLLAFWQVRRARAGIRVY